MGWVDNLPSTIAAVDVETTGLTEDDRIVGVGALWLSTAAPRDGSFPVSYPHLIFSPGRKSHWAARKVHGFGSSLLSKQEPFSAYAPQISSSLNSTEMAIALNAEFDLKFINRERRGPNVEPAKAKIHCSMQACRKAERPNALAPSVQSGG